MNEKYGKCAACPFRTEERLCRIPDGRAPKDCSTTIYEAQISQAVQKMEQQKDLMEFARQAALQEAACYGESPYDPAKRMPLKPRILEIIEFARRMDYRRLGLAFCIGLKNEAAALDTILTSHGFEVVSVCCKVGGVDKCFLGLTEDEKIHCGHESMCNPVAQAAILNKEKTDLNLMLGLCVGHDSLFIKFAQAPVTVVAVKDRLLGHNPLAALYSGYFAYLKK